MNVLQRTLVRGALQISYLQDQPTAPTSQPNNTTVNTEKTQTPPDQCGSGKSNTRLFC
jgi:hypothetical protein